MIDVGAKHRHFFFSSIEFHMSNMQSNLVVGNDFKGSEGTCDIYGGWEGTHIFF